MNENLRDYRLRLLNRHFGEKPNGWSIAELGSLFEERKEFTSDTENYPLHSFTIEGGVTPKTDRYYREFLLRDRGSNQYKVVHERDLIFNPMNLRFGAISISRVQDPVSVSAYYNVLRLNTKLCNPDFIEAYLRSTRMICIYDGVAIGSLLEKRRVHLSEFRKLKIYLPPIEEQDKIGTILETWGRALESTSQNIAAKERQKKSLMQQLLTGKVRLWKLGNQAWRKCRLGDLFEERKETNREDLPLLAITSDRGVIPRKEVDKSDSSSEDKSKYKRISPGDIGYNTMRMWQGVSALSNLEGIVSPAYTICSPKKDIDGQFASYLFKFPPMVYLFRRYSQGLVDDTLSLKFPNFAQIRVTVPSVQEQRQIAAVLSSVDKEIGLLQRQLELFKKQKYGLTQKLLTGRIRVKL